MGTGPTMIGTREHVLKDAVAKPSYTQPRRKPLSPAHLYLISNTADSSSSSSSSFSGAISTRSAGVVMMSYLRVFFNLFPNLEEEKHIHETTPGRDADEARPPYRWSSLCQVKLTSRHLETKFVPTSSQDAAAVPGRLVTQKLRAGEITPR